jgi:hypothetical protein
LFQFTYLTEKKREIKTQKIIYISLRILLDKNKLNCNSVLTLILKDPKQNFKKILFLVYYKNKISICFDCHFGNMKIVVADFYNHFYLLLRRRCCWLLLHYYSYLNHMSLFVLNKTIHFWN